MKTVLLATQEKFWLEDRGDRQRVAGIYNWLINEGFSVPVFFAGRLDEQDNHLLRAYQRPLTVLSFQQPTSLHKAIFSDIQARHNLLFYPQEKFHRTDHFERTFIRLENRLKQWVSYNVVGPYLSRRKPSREPQLDDFKSPYYQSCFREVCRLVQPDFVLVEFVRLAYLLQDPRLSLPLQTVTLVDTNDVMHLRCQRFHDAGERHWVNLDEGQEAKALEAFDVIVAIQKRDAEIFQGMLPHKQVVAVYHACPINPQPVWDRSEVLLIYIGTAGPHNVKAITGFLTSIWPSLRNAYGERLRLRIAGRVCTSLYRLPRQEGVELYGPVDSLEDFYAAADIAINPVSFGGGLKIKNVEALCFGKPLVTTSLGAEGLDDGAGRSFFVCDTHQAWIDTLGRLIESVDARREAATQAAVYAERHFDPGNAYAPLKEILCARSRA